MIKIGGIIFGIILLYTVLILVSASGVNVFGLNVDFKNTGVFGDSFGPLGTLMAAFAAGSAWLAYDHQRQELASVKQEGELERKSAYKRDFENTFFNMVELIRGTVQEIKVRDNDAGDDATGRSAIKVILNSYLERQRSSATFDNKLYEKIYDSFRDELGHYFRTLYHIVVFVDRSEISDKMQYMRLLRATLSNAEMVIIGLNCAHGGGREKFKPLVEKYALLHNISSSYAERWKLTELLEASAFGDRSISSAGKLES